MADEQTTTPAPATKQLFNARSQQVEDATLSVDQNNEVVATFEDGGFIKFPAGITQAEFEGHVQAHHEANDGQEVVTPEQEQAKLEERQASVDLINNVAGNPMPEEQEQSNAPDQPASPPAGPATTV